MDELANFLSSAATVEGPCLSLYQPTHRAWPEIEQDLIRYRNLLRSLEESLRQRYPKRDATALLSPFQRLAADETFWRHNREGLAVLGAQDVFRVYRLQRPVPELAIVADSFHLKPLLRIVQSADRYQVLALARDAVRLFEGNRDVLDEVELDPEVPRTRVEALGDERKEPHLHSGSYQPGARGPKGGAAVLHGVGGEKAEEEERDTERFFRIVDRAILERHSRPARLPLILAALPENQAAFRALSRNPFLLREGIDADPQPLAADELRERAWQVVQPHYLERLAGLVDMFGAARARELASDDLGEVAQGAVAGRVATLLIEADRQIPGRIDPQDGAIERGELADPETDDLLDDLGEFALRNGGQVVVVPSSRMPTRSGVAAIYRY